MNTLLQQVTQVATVSPAQEMWLRGEAPAMAAVYQAVAASISQCLNIDISVSNRDSRVLWMPSMLNPLS